jgi:hypothetical protein
MQVVQEQTMILMAEAVEQVLLELMGHHLLLKQDQEALEYILLLLAHLS